MRTARNAAEAAEPDRAGAEVFRREEAALRFAAGGPPVHTEIGQRRGGLIELLGAAGAGAFGPYIALPRGRYVARLRFRAGWAAAGAAALDVSADSGETRIGSLPFDGAALAGAGMAVEMPFEAGSDLSGVEVRLICRPGFTGALEWVEIVPVDAGD